MGWAAMPKTSVNKDRKPRARESNVRPNALAVNNDGIVDPVAEAGAMNDAAYGPFRAGVAPPIGGHVAATARCGRNVVKGLGRHWNGVLSGWR